MAGLQRMIALALILCLSCASSTQGTSCSSYHDVSVCQGILDSITSMDIRECNLAENCLSGLSCCCSPDMPLQNRIRCSARRRHIGYQIYRLNVKCQRIMVQQPNTPGC